LCLLVQHDILFGKCNLELYMTATESTEIGVEDGKGISVFSVAKSYKKQIRFIIIKNMFYPIFSRFPFPYLLK